MTEKRDSGEIADLFPCQSATNVLRSSSTTNLQSNNIDITHTWQQWHVFTVLKIKGFVLINHSIHSVGPLKALHHLADLFIRMSTQLLWEAFSQPTITARRIFTQIFPPLSIAEYSFIHLSELGQRGEREISARRLKQRSLN